MAKKKKRIDLDVRNQTKPFFRNYDYGGPENGSSVGPGTGLYHGDMSKYKSVKDFINKSRARRRKRRAELSTYLMTIVAAAGSLKTRLEALRPQMVVAAQKILDEWEQNEEGEDIEFGFGGCCDAISNAIVNVINFEDVSILDGGQDGDDHAYNIVYNDQEAYIVDIPPNVYETGGGYSWRKIPNVRLDVGDIVIEKINRNDLDV